MPEVWRPVVGYEGRYEVSDLGRVRSLLTGRVLRPNYAGRGYPAVSLRRDGNTRSRYVHHLVAEAFIGPRPGKVDVCHNNGNITDARAANLRYDTRHGNMRDALAHGTHLSVGRAACIQGHDVTGANGRVVITTSADGGMKRRVRCRKCDNSFAAAHLARKKVASRG